MKSRLLVALVLTGTVAAGAVSWAQAQQPPGGPAGAPPPAGSTRPAPPPPGGPRGGPDAFMGGPGMMDHMGMGMGMGGPRGHMSPEDRAAFLDARIAGVKAGLHLTPDQEKLWGPLESAIRDGVKRGEDMRRAYADKGPAADPVERLTRAADVATARGEIMHKIADAARPFYASLTDEQRHRLPALMHAGGGWRERMGEHMRHWREWGEEHFGRGHERGHDRERDGALQPFNPPHRG